MGPLENLQRRKIFSLRVRSTLVVFLTPGFDRRLGLVFGVRHEYGLFGEDQRIQRATRPLEDGTAFNMWEIAEAFKLEWGIGRRSSCAGAAGLRSFAGPQDDKLGGRTEGRGLPATSLQEGRKEGGREDGFPPANDCRGRLNDLRG